MPCPPPPPSPRPPPSATSGMRPPPFTLTLHALFTLPYRLCNPPPAAGNVRSCKVTPLIKVTLDDVLNKRHLPPLTLKDFEEWLVFVEGNPQYLYFILWLKEYESRYAAWLAESGCALPTASPAKLFASTTTLGVDADTPASSRNADISYINLIPSSPALALFFTRAKQTFLDPTSSSPYALGPAALFSLGPSTHSLTPSIPQFTTPEEQDSVGGIPAALANQPHPHPKELAPLATYARKVLKENLERFAQTACHNVGSRRAWCGIAGGTFITLMLGILPALTTFFFAPSRWWRIVGWLGCWTGGTIIVSSFHGICMMIYVFGDLRQLRSFELARPSISNPRAIARARPRLKSFFTRDDENVDGTGTGTGSRSVPSSKSSPGCKGSKPSHLTPAILDIKSNKGNDVRKEKDKAKKRPWSVGSASETSTGTPVVHFEPGAFRFGVGTGTMESDVTGTSRTGTADLDAGAEIDVGAIASEDVSGAGAGAAEVEEDDFGIEISPAYYYSGRGPTVDEGGGEGEGEKMDRRESVRSAGSRLGRVMRWMLGKRVSGGFKAGTGGGTEGDYGICVMSEKAGSVRSEKMLPDETQTQRSYAGTFGVRSWRGGLGSLPERSGNVYRVGGAGDLEEGVSVAHTTEARSPLESHDLESELGANPESELEENMLTAEFITRDYPKPDPDTCLCYHPNPDHEVDGNEEMGVKDKRMSSPVSPVKFDFDKLPAARRMSSPSSLPSSPVSPFPDSDCAMPPPQPLLLHPPLPVLYSHPGARIATPSPACAKGSAKPVAKERQWWDTCPRHPAVEATLAALNQPPSLAIQTHNLAHPRSAPPLPDTRSSLLVPPGPGSTRPPSLASSDVHSRVRVHSTPIPSQLYTSPLTIVPSKSKLRTKTCASQASRSETWRTRFRRVMAVPAFSPVTRVLEPLVSRGQWEIVIRSACLAALAAWIFIGCLVALPEIR